jgi:CheY-like chemotaxis protein
VVDDIPAILMLASLILDELNTSYCTFQSGEDALDTLTTAPRKPDLLITDFAMGGMNGLELIRLAKLEHPQLKTILMSGTVDEAILRTSQTHVDHFLSKPFKPFNFMAQVNRLLQQ